MKKLLITLFTLSLTSLYAQRDADATPSADRVIRAKRECELIYGKSADCSEYPYRKPRLETHDLGTYRNQ
jgi:hypothetical protein